MTILIQRENNGDFKAVLMSMLKTKPYYIT